MKFMTWSLKRPSKTAFQEYKQLPSTEPWYSGNFINGTGGTGFTWDEAPEKSGNWSKGSAGFLRMIEKYTNKFDAIGMHEWNILSDGTITSMVTDANGNFVYNALTSDESALNTDSNALVALSLRYLMHTYPQIRWGIQFLSSKEAQVNPLLDNTNGAQDKFMRQAKLIIQYYKAAGFPITDCEIDVEKTKTRLTGISGWTGPNDYDAYAAFLSRVKNEVCIPNSVGLRINIFAMTDIYTPSYYAYTDYDTLAQAKDMNGNQAVDEFQLMTYDFSWGGSAPGPSTPLDWLQSVVDNVNRVAARGHWKTSQVYIGNAGYGRRWPLHNTYQGKTFDYRNLMDAQNGMFVHNDGELPTPPSSSQTFHFYDQDFIPFAGFNDPNSDYQTNNFHVYDFFKTSQLAVRSDAATNLASVNLDVVSNDYYTNYSSDQTPIFTNAVVLTVGNTNENVGGNVHSIGSNGNPITAVGIPDIDAGVLNFRRPDFKGYTYDPTTNSCVLNVTNGYPQADGVYTFDFSGITPGTKRLVAIVAFTFFGNTIVNMDVAGTPYNITGTEDWYPYIVNPFCHMFDCGTFDLPASGTITIGCTSSGSVGGFIICDSFDPNVRGGQVTYDTMIQGFKKRGDKVVDYTITNDDNTQTEVGHSELIDAQWPASFTATFEMLRRPPRPAITWEDMFGPLLVGAVEGDNTDLSKGPKGTNFASASFPYYAACSPNSYANGSNLYVDVLGNKWCTTNPATATPHGYSQGNWYVFGKYTELNPNDVAYITTDSRGLNNTAQLILNHAFDSNMQIEIDISAQDVGAYGIRFLHGAPGFSGDGYIFEADFVQQKVRLMREQHTDTGSSIVWEAPQTDMTDSLKTANGTRLIINVQLININGTYNAICSINKVQYFNLALPSYPTGGGAHGVYCIATRVKVYRLTVSSLDRWERMERVAVEVDGTLYDVFGSVARNVGTDKFGLLMYTGLPGNVTAAVSSLPSDPNTDPNAGNTSRAGTIFETEITPEKWSQDFHNIPVQAIPGLVQGEHVIIFHLIDPGIWVRTMYIGDTKGFSVAYNSDKIGFIKTAKMIDNMKGIAMWTLGQEDPTIFDYIPDSE